MNYSERAIGKVDEKVYGTAIHSDSASVPFFDYDYCGSAFWPPSSHALSSSVIFNRMTSLSSEYPNFIAAFNTNSLSLRPVKLYSFARKSYACSAVVFGSP